MYELFLLYTLIGKLSIFILQKFVSGNLSKRRKLLGSKFLSELFTCDLCLGVWVYTALAVPFGINLIDRFYVPGLSWILTGAATSFIVFVFSNGWKSLFNVTVINSDFGSE